MSPPETTALVSVILPSFNHADFVGEAVHSVLNQSVRDLELIVVDDGSSDGTAEIAERIADPRLTVVRLTENRACHPRNLALGRARGRYVAFQNSDDVWHPEKLATQLDVMQRHAGVSACFTTAEIIDRQGRPTSGNYLDGIFATADRPSAEWLRHFFDVGNCFAIASAVARRQDVVDIGCFRGSMVQLGDYDLWVRLAALGEFRILPTPFVKIRYLKDGNLSEPSPAGTRRADLELADVLERYTAPPVFGRFDRIFPELAHLTAPGARKVALALRAWNRGGGPALFADRVVAAVMDDADERADAVSAHGTGFIRQFLERRGQAEYRHLGAHPA
jgi:glycosyltransferase involved in cell wall biosynthesis